MANFKAWVETTRAGNHRIRYRDGSINPETGELNKFDYLTVGKTERATIDGKLLVGKNLANEHCDKLVENYHRGKLGKFNSNEALLPLVDQFLDERENKNFSPRTITHDRISLMAMIKENSFATVNDLNNRDAIEKYIAKMMRRKLALWTIDGRLADVRTFLNWLAKIGKIGESAFGKGLMPKRKDSEPRYYTAQEYKELDEALAKVSPLTRLMCMFAHSAGLRKAEMVGHADAPVTSDRIQFEDIRWANHGAEILIRKELTKTNKSRTIPLDGGILKCLGSRRSGAIFPMTRYQVDHFFQRARSLAKINKDLTIHGLRHTFAKNYLQRGNGNIASLKALMGHASLVSTMIYAQFEKSYLHEGINKAYEQRLVEETLAGQNVVDIGPAGQNDSLFRQEADKSGLDLIKVEQHKTSKFNLNNRRKR